MSTSSPTPPSSVRKKTSINRPSKKPRTDHIPRPIPQRNFEGTGQNFPYCPEAFVQVDDYLGTHVYDLLSHANIIRYIEEEMETLPHLVRWFYNFAKVEIDTLGRWEIRVEMDVGAPLVYNDVDFADEFGVGGVDTEGRDGGIGEVVEDEFGVGGVDTEQGGDRGIEEVVGNEFGVGEMDTEQGGDRGISEVVANEFGVGVVDTEQGRDRGIGEVVPPFGDYDVKVWPKLLANKGIKDDDQLIRVLNNLDRRAGYCEEMEKTYDVKYFSGDDKVLLKIVKEVLFPCNSKTNQISRFHAVMVALIKYECPIDMSVLMATHLLRTLGKKKTSLAYGGLVSNIVQGWNFAVPEPENREPSRKPRSINKKTYVKMGSILVARHLVQHWEAPLLDEDDQVAYQAAFQDRQIWKNSGYKAPRAQVQGEQPPQGEQAGQVPDAQVEEPAAVPEVGQPSIREMLDRVLQQQETILLQQGQILGQHQLLLDQQETVMQRTDNLTAGNVRIERKQDKIVRYLRRLGEAWQCSDYDLDELDSSSSSQ